MSATDGTPQCRTASCVSLNVIRDREPAYVGVVFDPPGPTFRNDVFRVQGTAANRPTISPQFSLCRQAVTALGIPALEMGGFEADDVIGTRAEVDGLGPERKCAITADKDIMQLVGDQISMWMAKKRD